MLVPDDSKPIFQELAATNLILDSARYPKISLRTFSISTLVSAVLSLAELIQLLPRVLLKSEPSLGLLRHLLLGQ